MRYFQQKCRKFSNRGNWSNLIPAGIIDFFFWSSIVLKILPRMSSNDNELRMEDCYRLMFEKVRLHGLVSESGSKLNGRTGVVVGMDGLIAGQDRGLYEGIKEGTNPETFRVYVELDGQSDSVKKIRPANIKLLGPSISFGAYRLSEKEIEAEFAWVLHECETTKLGTSFGSRLDCAARQDVLVSRMREGRFPNDKLPRCCDTSVGGRVDPYANYMLRMLTTRKPMCAGSGEVDFAMFGTGLFASGDSDCPLCLSRMERGTPASLLPCGHQFHPDCVSALDAHRVSDPNHPRLVIHPGEHRDVVEACGVTCPVCRHRVTGTAESNLAHHSTPSADRLHQRFAEYVQSGMCCFCQMLHIEQSQFSEEIIHTPQGPAKTFISNHTRQEYAVLQP